MGEWKSDAIPPMVSEGCIVILVTGAGGKTGLAIIRGLANRGIFVRALVRRDVQRNQVLLAGAVEAVVGDMNRAGDLATAMRGMEKVYFICPNMHPREFEIGQMGISVAKDAGISTFAYHSVLHPQTEQMPHHWKKMRVESALFESGQPFIIVQPTAYIQNIFAYWSAIIKWRVYAVPYPINTPLSLVDVGDVGEAVASLLANDDFLNGTYELVGTKPWTPKEIAGILSRTLNREITARQIPLAEWEANARQAGLADYTRITLSKMFQYYAQWGLVGSPYLLTNLLKRPPHHAWRGDSSARPLIICEKNDYMT